MENAVKEELMLTSSGVTLLKRSLVPVIAFVFMVSSLIPSISAGQVVDNDSADANNDTIATAMPLGLTAESSNVAVEGAFAQRFGNPANSADATEDVDMYSVDLQAGDRITVDADSVRFPLDGVMTGTSPDLRIFNAEGDELIYVRIAAAPNEHFVSDRDAYVDFTADVAGTYYIGASHYRNEFYDPEAARSGSGRIQTRTAPGAYTLEIALNPTGPNVEPFVESTDPPPAGPVVSLLTVTGTFVDGDNILSSQLVETGGIENASGILDITFNVEGDIPAEGIEVIVKSDKDFAANFETPNLTPGTAVGGELLGAIYNADGTLAGIRVRLLANNARFPFFLAADDPLVPATDDDPDAPETITFALANSPNYAANPEASTSTVTIYDTLEQVQASAGPVPQVGISIDQPMLVESEGTRVTLTVNVTGTIPDDGLLVYMAGEQPLLGDFDVFNATITGGAFPAPNSSASGFFFRVFANTATISLQVFDETTNPEIPPELVTEGVEEFTLSVVATEAYTVDPAAGAVTFTIKDNPDSVPLPPPPPPSPPTDGDPALLTDNDTDQAHDDAIWAAVPTLLGIVPAITIEGTIELRWNPDGPSMVDNTEDVDMFSFILEAGESVTIDLDSVPFLLDGIEQKMSGILRLFNSAGEELASNDDGAAPDEEPNPDAYLEFTAPATGLYYIGVSQASNNNYDPQVVGSGDGLQLIPDGISPGPYTLALTFLAVN
jgi:Bacterial pre-peptidase C-terminal domain